LLLVTKRTCRCKPIIVRPDPDLDLDLNKAMKFAVREAVELLQDKAGLTAAEAYSVASMGVDFRVAEAVDSVRVIYATIPKKFFKRIPDYWRGK
jgi:acetamidase/formamidase